MADLAPTLNTRRSALAIKDFLVASNLGDLRMVESISVHHVLQRRVLGFDFTGQGAQKTDEILDRKAASNIHTPEVAQPANTALQIALVDLLGSVGVSPAAVVGHSSGEIAAAYAYGALSAGEAMAIAYFKGLCTADLAQIQQPVGAMIAVALSEEESRS
jgi:malonyl CoA-acyl carrier protein transacylase